MSIEDHMTTESNAKAMTVKVSLDIQGYADEIADEVDEQIFHSVAARKGYVKERTCRLLVIGIFVKCSNCGWRLRLLERGSMKDPNYCPNCGAKVEADFVKEIDR